MKQNTPDSTAELKAKLQETFESLHSVLERYEFPEEIRQKAAELEKMAAENVSESRKLDSQKHEINSTFTELIEKIRKEIKKNEWLKSIGKEVVIKLLIEAFKKSIE